MSEDQIVKSEMNDEHLEIDLLAFMKAVLSKWYLMIVFVIIGASIMSYYTDNYVVPTYRTSSKLFISEQVDSVISGVSTGDIALDSVLLRDYKELIKTSMVANMIIEELGLNVSIGQLTSNVQMTSSADSRFVNLSYVDTDPVRAATIANKYSEILRIQAREVIGADNVQIIDLAPVPRYPFSPNKSRNMMMGGIGGLAVSFGLILLLFILDDKIKDDIDLENTTGLPVLGIIPKFKGVKR